MRLCLTTLLVIIGFTLHAQNKGIISGKVLDTEKKPLEKATVSILNKIDSTVISYTLADDKGSFKIYKVPLQQDLTLVVSYVGTSPYSEAFKLKSEEEYDMGEIILDGTMLNEVEISIQPPVRMNNDTLEYNADYFKTRPNASVEELMKKLPGLQVNLDGSIYYQGKEVTKVLVNNKEFFAQDLKIATRNLDASMVDVVQVFRDKGDSKMKVEDESTLPITINLKFKKELARAEFGKFYGSGGTQDRYELGALVNTFRDTLQVSFIGFGNNINRQSFDYSELSQYGGLQRSENYGFSNFGGRNYDGVQNDVSGGVNINYDWGKITKLNIMYQYTYGDQLGEHRTENESFFDETTQIGSSTGGNTNKKHKHSLSGRFNHKFDTTSYMTFVPRMSFDKSRGGNNSISSQRNLTESINDIKNSSNNDNQSVNYSHSLNYEKSFNNRKTILSLSNSLSYNSGDRNSISDQLSTIYKESLDPRRRLFHTDNITNDFNSRFGSNLQLKLHKKLSADLFTDYSFSKNERAEELAVAIDDGALIDRDDSEDNLNFTTRDYAVGTKLAWNAHKNFSLTAGVKGTYKHNTFDYLDVLATRENKEWYWLPSFSIRFKELSVSYSKSLSQPRTYSIRAVDNTLNDMWVSKAFPYAENIVSDQFNVNYYKSFNNYKNQLNIYGSSSRESYSIGYNNTVDLERGSSETAYYVAPSTMSFNLGGSYSMPIKLSEKWTLRVREGFHTYLNNSYVTMNGVENKGTQWSSGVNQEFTFSWKEIIAVSPKYDFNFTKNFVSVDNPNFKTSVNTSHSFTTGINVNNVKKMSLETSYSIRVVKGGFKDNPVMNIINMSFYYDMPRKGQIKFSVFDLLNQNLMIYNGSSHNTNYSYESRTLKQYFLLGYVYKFNKAKMKD